jgi:hypothetical protein
MSSSLQIILFNTPGDVVKHLLDRGRGRDALGYCHERQDEKRNVGLGPEHDWSSHAADAFGYMAIAYEEPPAKSMAIRRPSAPRIGGHWAA